MWALAKDVIGILFIIFVFSQLVMPSFIPGMSYWNLFKKPVKKEPAAPSSSLDELSEKAEAAAKAKQEVQEQVSSTEEKLKSIKTKLN